MGAANAKPIPSSQPRIENGRRKDSTRKPRPEVVRNAASSGEGRGEREREGVGGGSEGHDGDTVVKRVASMKLAVEEEMVDGWPKWLTDNIPREVLAGLVPKSADSYDKINKVGQGTYSNVYKARDRDTGKIVALKKVKFDTSESESVKFMAREIMILQKLDHPNIVKLEGLATSRMQYSLYLVLDYMLSDLSRVISRPGERLSEPQIKCYMHQLLSGLQHCHERGILHRDIKGSNLLIDKDGTLKIADFGLANYSNKRHLTSRVVTLWYRAPELLLGANEYGVGIDLWSAGCLMAEMFSGRPIMPGRTEELFSESHLFKLFSESHFIKGQLPAYYPLRVYMDGLVLKVPALRGLGRSDVEQLHKIFRLCGTPTEDYWKRSKAPATFRPPQAYKPNLPEIFRNFPPSSLGLLKTLLALDPALRGTASSALKNEFFSTSPLACDLSGLPVIYQEEEDPPVTERRRHRSSKMRQRSKTLKQRARKDLDDDKPKGDSGSPKEEEEKITDPNPHNNSSTSSTSSSLPRTEQREIVSGPPPLLSPDVPSSLTKSRPPLPLSKTKTTIRSYDNDDEDTNKYRNNRVQRSISTKEFRRVDQKKILKLQAIED